ncbi:MAG TPA: 4-(cytidine 5'-diphospho)-2-C-methyl-D-erythritol kinase [Candidatus Mediterraneibacter pullistercoris]|nr:4-(cytidine 5'-diphospho)-2-C-methyl-D-erythritol kinase [Candidatus Mediterraneibacter pullistercoris]
MNQVELRALAKINLGLDVLGRRENGYHDVRMIMQSIYLYDEVKIEKMSIPGVEVATNLDYLPTGGDNIAYKAAKLLRDEFRISDGVKITLNKHIPVAAGLAGGSSNAAAVLFGMNRMFRLGLSQKSLMDRGLKLGADVPYCIMRGTVLAEGIGEELKPLPDMPKCTVLIAKPPVSVSTKAVYEALDSKEITAHPDIDAIIKGLEQHDLRKIAGAMGNVLEDVTIPMHPVIARIKQEMIEAGALGAMMSGSGPTVFGLFASRSSAREAQKRIREKALTRQVYVTNMHSVRRNQHGG